MNKTVAFIVIGVVALIGLIGVILLMALGVDAAPFIAMFSTMLPIVITAAVTINTMEKINGEVGKVKTLVNGNTTKLIGMIDPSTLTFDDQIALANVKAANDALIKDDYGPGRHVAS